MARPKRLRFPAKINLMIEEESKYKAIEIAKKRGISVGRLFEYWLSQELNGSIPKEDSSES
jgi:hypothetical protein